MDLNSLMHTKEPYDWDSFKPAFPKPIMTRKELVKMGFSIDELKRVCYVYENINNAIAWQVNPGKKTSPWKYNVEALWDVLQTMKQQGRY